MPRILLFSILFFLPAVSGAQAPILVSDTARAYPVVSGPLAEETVIVDGAARALTITYSSDAPVELKVSFPFETEEGMSYNPLRTLQWKDVPAGDHWRITLNLTQSPAWSPTHDTYLLHIVAPPGATVSIHDIDRTKPTMSETITAVIKQLAVDEPALLSSVNFLWGYSALDVSMSLVLGGGLLMVLLAVTGYWLLVTGRKFSSFLARPELRRRVTLSTALIFLLLYDARFSFDLLKTSARDLTEWNQKGEYRQLGPLFRIADLLKDDSGNDIPMRVSMCLGLDDIYLKQLRYRLYPAPVQRSNKLWDDATHLVLIGKTQKLNDDGTIVCDAEQMPRTVRLMQAFDEGTKVYRFVNP